MSSPSTSAAVPVDAPSRRVGFALLGLVVLVVAAYASLWHSDFTMLDDDNHVFGNPLVKSGLSWEQAHAAFTQVQAGLWIPLTWLSLALDVSLFGLNPVALHVSNLVLHLLASLLLFRASRILLEDAIAAFIVTALFALHPLNVESVAWITERKNVLSAVFWMLSLGSYAKYAKEQKPWALLTSLVWFACGLMAKPAVTPLPCVFLLLDLWPLRRLSRSTALRLIVEKVPFFALTALASIITVHAQTTGSAVVGLDQISLATRFGYAAESLVWYLEKLVWPASLALFYPHPLTISWVPAIASAITLAGITVALLWQARSRPQWIIGWLWFVGVLVPTLGFVQVGSVARADRFAYLPQIGLWIALAVSLAPILRGPGGKVVGLASAGLLLGLAAATAHQAAFWEDNISVFERAVVVTPRNPLALRNAAMARSMNGQNDLALAYYHAALTYEPSSAQTWDHMGVTFNSMGRTEDALKSFENAIKCDPKAPAPRKNAAIALIALHREAEAQRQLEEAIRLAPHSGPNYFLMARAQAQQGDRAKALETLRSGIAACPGERPLEAELQRLSDPNQPAIPSTSDARKPDTGGVSDVGPKPKP